MVDRAARILIVGGGIAGLTLANALVRRGFSPELVEREPEWPAVGAGIAVQPNGMRILEQLGLAEATRRAGAVIRRWAFSDARGDALCETDLEGLWGDVGSFVGIERRALRDVLLTAAASVATRLGTGVTALADDGERVSVRFSDGSSNVYDLVVACDGVHSTVRSLVCEATPLADGGQMVWRSVAPIRPHGLDSLLFLLAEGSFFGLCPTAAGWTYGFANTTEPRFHDPVQGRLARLRARFTSYAPIVTAYLAALTSDEQVHCSAIEWVAREEWRRGRVVLIGDAAHASSPIMGQGGSMAMEDAFVLAEELRAAGDVAHALAAFTARRTPRVDWVRRQGDAAAKSVGLPAQARNAFLRNNGDAMLRARYLPLREPP